MKETCAIFMLAFLLGITGLNAQTYAEEETEEDKREQLVQTGSALLKIFTPAQDDPRIESLQGNSVFLKQIGEFNRAAILTNTERSLITVEQNGNENLTALLYSTRGAFANLKQEGDLNVIRDFVINPTIDVSLDLEQQGDGLYFERFGANRLTRSLRFVQTEASPTIIVRSFN